MIFPVYKYRGINNGKILGAVTLSQDTQLINELLEKLIAVENEMSLLREDRKELVGEYKEKLDIKAFQAAMRIFKIRQQADNNLAIDQMLTVMEVDNG
jgi:uncharacterized protein (UPF0335 family)